MATEILVLAEEFGRIASGAPAGSLEDVALDYHDAAERAGTVLMEAYRAGLLAKIPGLAKLIGRGLEPARLFKQFHGYEVNVGVLLSARPAGARARDTSMTCGLLPQLLPDHPVFRRRAFRGKNADRRALMAELRRAAEACKWLAEQTSAEVGDQPEASRGRTRKKAAAKALANSANTRRTRKTNRMGRENLLGLGSDVKCRSR
jgi:hypothetical protein